MIFKVSIFVEEVKYELPLYIGSLTTVWSSDA